jgi:hypothetical protein
VSKNAKIGLVVACGVGLLFGGCVFMGLIVWLASSHRPVDYVTPEQMRASKVEIENVLTPMQRLYTATIGKDVGRRPAQRHPVGIPVLTTYIDGLYAIDVSRCPADFRAAYLELIRAYEKRKNYAKAHAGLDDLFSLGVAYAATGPVGPLEIIANGNKELQAMQNEMNEAKSQIRLVAKKYNASGFEAG